MWASILPRLIDFRLQLTTFWEEQPAFALASGSVGAESNWRSSQQVQVLELVFSDCHRYLILQLALQCLRIRLPVPLLQIHPTRRLRRPVLPRPHRILPPLHYQTIPYRVDGIGSWKGLPPQDLHQSRTLPLLRIRPLLFLHPQFH